MLKNKKVILTGAGGFIGGHVVEALLSEGAQVTCVVRKLNTESYLYKKGLHRLCELKKIDLTSKRAVKNLFNRNRFSFVFHLAGKLRPISHDDAFSNNVVATVNVLEAVKDAKGIEGIVVASTTRSAAENIKRTAVIELLKKPYDFSKTGSDLMVQSYIESYHLPIATVQYGNVFGPGDEVVKPLRITAQIMECFVKGKLFKPLDAITHRVEFVYVKDVARAFALAANNIKKIRYRTVVLPMPWQVRGGLEWSRMVAAILNNSFRAGSSKTLVKKNILSWKPRYSLKNAVKETFEWYQVN